MGIHEEILAWSSVKLTPWRQDALRRLCENGELTAGDLDQIYDLAKQHHGLSPGTDPALAPLHFTEDHFPAAPQAVHQVAVTSLHSLANVGLIAPGQALDFQPTGLTIVYGGNGSGKSGYARILKQACRARSPGMVYANAYAEDYAALTPSATIDFTVDGKLDQASWVSRKACRPELRAVSVFDSDCADHYLKSQETAAYQPTVFGHLQELALGISKALGSRVDAEFLKLQLDTLQFNVIPEDTEAGRAIRPLSPTIDLTKVEKLATLSPDELTELEKLPSEIAEADPTIRAENLENNAAKVEATAAALEKAKTEVSGKRIQSLQELRQKLTDAEAAEKAAAGLLQSEEPDPLLPGTGESVWATLFRAAQKFSVTEAYSGQPFPVVVGEGARCLLCQQSLRPDARARMLRFNKFINDTASAVATAARSAHAKEIDTIAGIVLPATPSQTMLDSLAKRTPELPQQIKDLHSDLSKRLGWFREAITSNIWTGEPSFSAQDPSLALTEITKELRSSAKSLRDNIDPELLSKKRARLKELEARVLLSKHIPSIRTVVGNLDTRAKLSNCKADITSTRGISSFAKKLAKNHISDSLAMQMAEEVKRLDLHHIDASVEFDGDYGAVRLRVMLPNANLSPHQVLSEAEQRICSLAYFFAEQSESRSTSCVVFDDPVTSLDHNHRTAVARRIVEEAVKRQVIVFTHDAVFFGELRFFAEDHGIAPEIRSMEHRAEGPGFIDAALPWDMRGHNARMKEHRLRHRHIANDFNNPPADHERLAMRNAYNDLRATLEIGIEDIVLNGAVARFRDGISVGKLDGVTVVEHSEFVQIQTLHNRCCRQVSAHSHARGQQRAVPQPSDLLSDIEAIDTLLKGIRNRRN